MIRSKLISLKAEIHDQFKLTVSTAHQKTDCVHGKKTDVFMTIRLKAEIHDYFKQISLKCHFFNGSLLICLVRVHDQFKLMNSDKFLHFHNGSWLGMCYCTCSSWYCFKT